VKREKKQVGQDQPGAPTAGELPENWMAPGATLDVVFRRVEMSGLSRWPWRSLGATASSPGGAALHRDAPFTCCRGPSHDGERQASHLDHALGRTLAALSGERPFLEYLRRPAAKSPLLDLRPGGPYKNEKCG